MAEPTITCPNCKTAIKLTESLAAPLIEATKTEYERRLALKDAAIADKEKALREEENAIRDARESLDREVAEKLAEERAKIAAEEAKKAKQILQTDLDSQAREITDLKGVLEAREKKLAEAQAEQAELLRKQRALDDEKRELDLTIEKRVRTGLAAAREEARKQAETELGLKVAEREQTISSMQKQIEELKRKAEQGSQQLQGEVLELELEAVLTSRFPTDTIEPVGKGEHGGDILHRVVGLGGSICGTILWESKRTRNWSDGWLSKLRDDQRAAKADVAALVSQALPKGLSTFELIDGVWVIPPALVPPVAAVLRQSLIEISVSRKATEGQQTKQELVYAYLTGSSFRQRVQAIVEAFSAMEEDLERERKLLTKQWEKRRQQLTNVMKATVGMYGDLQGIAGKTLAEIEGLDLPALGDGVETEAEAE